MVREYSFTPVSFKKYPAIGCNIDDFDYAVPGSSKHGCISRRGRRISVVILILILLVVAGSFSCYYCLEAKKEIYVTLESIPNTTNSSPDV